MRFSAKISCFIKLFFCFLLLSTTAYAKEIDLYDQPKTDAKVIAKIDLSAGIVPIFTPKEGNWIKVGDPRNGNVGWVKSSDLNAAGNSVTFTQRFVNEGQGPQSYQVIQYGQPQKLTPQQKQEMMQNMQQKQRELQDSYQKAVQQIMDSINDLSQHQFNLKPEDFPIIMPIVIVPKEQQKAQPTTKPTAPQNVIPAKAGTSHD